MNSELVPLSLPKTELFGDILGRVLRLPSVASKRYLTNKVQRLHSFFATGTVFVSYVNVSDRCMQNFDNMVNLQIVYIIWANSFLLSFIVVVVVVVVVVMSLRGQCL